MTKRQESSNSNQRILLVGWDAADWKVISPLMERGCMPHLLQLVERGVKGNIATLHPVLSPMLWTSIATGKRPYKHGIYGFYEPTPDGMAVQPITNLSRQTRAIWNILSQSGFRTNVVGWWPSHPAEPINGVMVSDMYHKNSLRQGRPDEIPDGAIHPPERTAELDELRLGIQDLHLEDIMNFIPLAQQIDQSKDKRVAMCAKILAECTTIHAAATHLLDSTEWDFMAVYYDAIDHFSHGFMKYHPPRQEFIPERDFELYKDVITGAYMYHDMMLGRLIELAGPDTTIMLVSDHGFHPDHMRPAFIPLDPAGPAIEHRDLGIFVMAGPGIVQDELVFGTSLLDITPTILTHMGLPVGEDMDGRVVAEVFEGAVETTTIPSWDEVAGEAGCHPPGLQLNPLESKRFLQQLVDLGYIDELSPNSQKNVDKAVLELRYNLARAYMDAWRYADALPLLSELFEQYPDEQRVGIQLALCLKAMGQVDELEQLVEQLTTQRVASASDARGELAEMNRTIQERLASTDAETGDGESEQPALTPELLQCVFSEAEQMRYLRLRSLAGIRTYYLDFLRGYALSAQGRNQEALLYLQRAIDAEPRKPSLYIQIGEIYLNLKMLDEAKSAFDAALDIDDTNPTVLLGLARYFLASRQNRLAVRHALDSIAITYFKPMAHYVLGVALHRLNRPDKALVALENAVSQNPNFAEAYELLARICTSHLEDRRAADHYRKLAQQSRAHSERQRAQRGLATPQTDRSGATATAAREPDPDVMPGLRTLPNQPVHGRAADLDPDQSIIVVSGLPRSGTSLMMQMLQAGGVEVMQDEHRRADEDNPRGYIELQQTRSLLTDNRWVKQACGKAIKVVAPLLEGLPAALDYKVILMFRNFEEIVASQAKMLQRQSSQNTDISKDQLLTVLKYQFEVAVRLLHEKGIHVLRVPYRTAVMKPQEVAQAVTDFLGLQLDTLQMAAEVDESLYRNRAAGTSSSSNQGA